MTGCLSVTANRVVFPYAEFAATTAGFADDDDGTSALVYEWGVLDGSTRVPKSIDATTSVKFTNLPKGGTWV